MELHNSCYSIPISSLAIYFLLVQTHIVLSAEPPYGNEPSTNVEAPEFFPRVKKSYHVIEDEPMTAFAYYNEPKRSLIIPFHHRKKKKNKPSRSYSAALRHLQNKKTIDEHFATKVENTKRFYYFNEKLPASRLPTPYDAAVRARYPSLLSIGPSSGLESNKGKRQEEGMWEPLTVDMERGPFSFSFPIVLTGGGKANESFNPKEILFEATRYKNPIDFSFDI